LNKITRDIPITRELIKEFKGVMPDELRGTKQGDEWLVLEGMKVCHEQPLPKRDKVWTSDDSPDGDGLVEIGGTKYDNNKPMGSIVYEYFPHAVLAIAEVSTFGATKYARGGWQHVPNGIERYTDAMHRHQLQEACGEEFDQDSGLTHAAHAAWGALCRLELMIREAKKNEK